MTWRFSPPTDPREPRKGSSMQFRFYPTLLTALRRDCPAGQHRPSQAPNTPFAMVGKKIANVTFKDAAGKTDRPARPQGQEGGRRRLPVVRVPRLQQLRPAAGRPGTRTYAEQRRRLRRRLTATRTTPRPGRQAGREFKLPFPVLQDAKLRRRRRPQGRRSRPRRSCSITTSSCATAAASTTATPPASRRTRRSRSHDLRRCPRRAAGRQGRQRAGDEGRRLPDRARRSAIARRTAR